MLLNVLKTSPLDNQNKNKGFVVLPYVEGLSEKASRVFKNMVSLRPSNRTALSKVFLYKDKRDSLKTAEAIYEIPCNSCPTTYIGETGRVVSTRISEHKSEAYKFGQKTFTRSKRKTSTSETCKSAIAEHVARNNHVIGWREASSIDQESDKTTRWL